MATFGRKNKTFSRLLNDEEISNSDKSLDQRASESLAQTATEDKLQAQPSTSYEGMSLKDLEAASEDLLASRGRGRPSKEFLNKKRDLDLAIAKARHQAGLLSDEDYKRELELNTDASKPTVNRKPARSFESFIGLEHADGKLEKRSKPGRPAKKSEQALKDKDLEKPGLRNKDLEKPGLREKRDSTRSKKEEQAAPAAQSSLRKRSRVHKAAQQEGLTEQGSASVSAENLSRQRGQRGSSAAAFEQKPAVQSRTERGERQERQERGERGTQQANNNRRNTLKNRYHEVSPKLSREELDSLEEEQLLDLAEEYKVEAYAHETLDDLREAIYKAAAHAEGFIEVAGILDILPEGYGFIRSKGYLPSEEDSYVAAALIKRNGLRKGDYINGVVRPIQGNEKYPALHTIKLVNGRSLEIVRSRPKFGDLTPIYPDNRLVQEHGKSSYTGRCIDLLAPIGKGQRGLIVSPPKAGKTTILKKIAESVALNNPEVHLMCLLVDERPEEVTDMRRSIKGEVIASTFDMPSDQHIAVAELVIERAKRLVEIGEDVVILLDSITRLARAYNLAQPASGRILSGGVDSTALYPPKRFLGAARNIENGGSLTILASALIDTGSKMDEVIFEEFKGTGNMELKLDRDLADKRIFPAIDPIASGTRQEDLLIAPSQLPFIWGIRRILASYNSVERAMTILLKSLNSTDSNEEFLVRSAKKAQGQEQDGAMEL